MRYADYFQVTVDEAQKRLNYLISQLDVYADVTAPPNYFDVPRGKSPFDCFVQVDHEMNETVKLDYVT